MTPFDLWRRRCGLIFIGGAVLMTLLGLTALGSRLDGLGFIAYWLACAGLAVLALATAVLDLMIVNARGREERKQLARQTAAEIQAAVRARESGSSDGSTRTEG